MTSGSNYSKGTWGAWKDSRISHESQPVTSNLLPWEEKSYYSLGIWNRKQMSRAFLMWDKLDLHSLMWTLKAQQTWQWWMMLDSTYIPSKPAGWSPLALPVKASAGQEDIRKADRQQEGEREGKRHQSGHGGFRFRLRQGWGKRDGSWERRERWETMGEFSSVPRIPGPYWTSLFSWWENLMITPLASECIHPTWIKAVRTISVDCVF